MTAVEAVGTGRAWGGQEGTRGDGSRAGSWCPGGGVLAI